MPWPGGGGHDTPPAPQKPACVFTKDIHVSVLIGWPLDSPLNWFLGPYWFSHYLLTTIKSLTQVYLYLYMKIVIFPLKKIIL